MKFQYVVLFVLFTTAQTVFSQDKTYKKEIFPLLEVRAYDEVLPKLEEYINDPKHEDEASPHYQYGLIISKRFSSYDLLNDTLEISNSGDSAISFLTKAKGLIDEKELKKNDEYWQAFYRRDLRTGDFGIKTSDVHLDIEKHIEEIEMRMADVRLLHKALAEGSQMLSAITERFGTLTSKYATFNSMLFLADDAFVTELDQLAVDAASIDSQFAQIVTAAKKLELEALSSEPSLKSIESFGVDGMSKVSLGDEAMWVWDYAKWSQDVKKEIQTSVMPFKEAIATYGEEIKATKVSLMAGEATEIPEVSNIITKGFSTYDSGSVVLSMLMAEQLEAEIIASADTILNPILTDSTQVYAQFMHYKAAYAAADELYTLSQAIDVLEVEQASTLYQDYFKGFAQRYGSAMVYGPKVSVWALNQRVAFDDAVEYWEEKSQWGVTETDTIALFVQDYSTTDWITRGVPINNDEQVTAYGFSKADSVGAIYSFAANRRMQWQLEFDTPGIFDASFEADTTALVDDNFCLYVYNEGLEKNNLVIVSFNLAGEENWKTTATAERGPVAFSYDELTGMLTVLFYQEDELPVDPENPGYITIDYAGNIN